MTRLHERPCVVAALRLDNVALHVSDPLVVDRTSDVPLEQLSHLLSQEMPRLNGAVLRTRPSLEASPPLTGLCLGARVLRLGRIRAGCLSELLAGLMHRPIEGAETARTERFVGSQPN